jgi:hypothetical protein
MCVIKEIVLFVLLNNLGFWKGFEIVGFERGFRCPRESLAPRAQGFLVSLGRRLLRLGLRPRRQTLARTTKTLPKPTLLVKVAILYVSFITFYFVNVGE